MFVVKTITITITEELDVAAATEARRRGISKSEFIRLGLEALLPADLEPVKDPWLALAGFADPGLSAAPGDIDDVVYGS